MTLPSTLYWEIKTDGAGIMVTPYITDTVIKEMAQLFWDTTHEYRLDLPNIADGLTMVMKALGLDVLTLNVMPPPEPTDPPGQWCAPVVPLYDPFTYPRPN